MIKLIIAFSNDPSGMSGEIIETISIDRNVCLYDLHDKVNRIPDLIKEKVKEIGYSVIYFELLKVYVI